MATNPSDWCKKTSISPKEECEPLRVSSLCEKGWRPLLLTGMFRDMLVRHFADVGNIEDNDLRRYVWSDSERTGILIESVWRWLAEPVEKRPAVLLKRNAMKQVRVSINDLSGRDEKGFERFTVIWVGSHTFFCVGGTGASAEVLSTEVARELTEFAPAVRQTLGLLKYAVTEVGAISEVEEATENFAVPVTLGWAYQENWILQVESLPLRRIPLSFILDCPLTGESTRFGYDEDKFG